ncbi:hypothetical protein [Mycolicibacterium smegmatis]|nr:hypothetical protein [Mycolicibacterium smegmatis]ULN32580.1 hypothetical protein KZ781_16815 [Mycolicibacterium smegmatis]
MSRPVEIDADREMSLNDAEVVAQLIELPPEQATGHDLGKVGVHTVTSG